MRFSYEYKMKCVEMYQAGMYPDTPEGISQMCFRAHVRKWSRLEIEHGPEILKRKNQYKTWTSEEKLELVSKVLSGQAVLSVAVQAGISDGMLRNWIRKYKAEGYNGLVDKKRGRPTEVSKVKSKKLNINNPRKLDESELEELIRLREENKYIKAENEVIKKEIALREEKQAALLKAKKQQ